MIHRFHAAHVKSEVAALLGSERYVHNDGSTIAVHTGYGEAGRQSAQQVIHNCAFPAVAQEGERLGSFKDKERWESEGVLLESYVLITRKEDGPATPAPARATDATARIQQYRTMKQALPTGTLLLFRFGVYYDLFFEDAEVAAHVLNITLLTQRG